jgi:hypothetical protein
MRGHGGYRSGAKKGDEMPFVDSAKSDEKARTGEPEVHFQSRESLATSSPVVCKLAGDEIYYFS